uniref:DEG/ENaC family ion channel ENaC7 n=1 Tax=Platynereis dumerilii TaxID=6359 RepID=A0A2S1B6Q3_PLADU|nr:DEG/ENaC family ion channel ENaC7 [Platynereis dumerilii]
MAGKRVLKSKSNIAHLFWLLVCLAAIAMFCMQMAEVLQRYFSYPKKVTVEVIPAQVPFPAVSLCNMRNMDVHVLNTLNRKFIEDHNLINHINNSDNDFVREYMKLSAKYGPLWYKYQGKYPLAFQEVFSRTTYSANIPQHIVSSAAVQLDEFVVSCYFGEYHCNTTNDFTLFFDPYYFNCFTYNMADPGQATSSGGIENGWSSVLYSGSGILDRNKDIRVLPGLHESRSAMSANEGVRVVIHPPGTIPFPLTEGFDVPPGFSASFGIRPRQIKRIGPPHGNCITSNPFGDSSSQYRVLSCQKTCLQRYIINSCGCQDKTLPDVPDLKATPCRNATDFPDSCMTDASDECLKQFFHLYDRIQCVRSTKDRFMKNSSLLTDCGCFPQCDEISYDVSYSLSKWPASGYEGDAAFFDIFYIEGFRERFLNTPKYNMVMSYFREDNREKTMQDFARLNVYIADSNVIVTQEMEDYPTTQLLSDIVGQLGLWIGICIIVLAVILHVECSSAILG